MRAGIATLLIVLSASLTLHAQVPSDESWKSLDFGLHSGFGTGLAQPVTASSFFFSDTANGYYYAAFEGQTDALHYFRTTDGGSSWNELDQYVPVPNQMLSPGFGYSPLGFTTSDGGDSWQKLEFNYPDPQVNFTVVQAAVLDTSHMAVGYRSRIADPSSGELVPTGPLRLAYTTNGGADWVSVDTLLVDTIAGTTDIRLRLYDSTGFGPFPKPDNMTDIFSIGWYQLVSMPNATTLRVIASAYGRVDGTLTTVYFQGLLNIATGVATWQRLPFEEVVPGVVLTSEGIRFPSALAMIAVLREGAPSSGVYTMWKSTDGGQTWDHFQTPAWLDYASLTFTSATHAVSSNGISDDGGMTWTQWTHPFEGGRFQAIDSSHFVVANRYSLFARSTDAGTTWLRNESGGLPRSVAAYNGTVLVGRNYGSLLVSADTGATWTDVGLAGSLPRNLSTVWAFGFPDPIAGSNRVVGVASFTPRTDPQYYAVIASSDGGMTWSEGQRLPELDGAGTSIGMSFSYVEETSTRGYISSVNGLLVSNDTGRTWTSANDIALRTLAPVSGLHAIGATSAALFNTTDGGATWNESESLNTDANRTVGFACPDGNACRVLLPNRSDNYTSWRRGVSSDDGATWTFDDHTDAPRPLDGNGHWTSPEKIYAIGRYATVQFSGDTGSSFTLYQDSLAEFVGSRGWIATGADRWNVYVIGAGYAAGAWQHTKSIPMLVRQRQSVNVAARVVGNPVRDDLLDVELSLPPGSHATIAVVDVLGRSVVEPIVLDATGGLRRERVSVRDLPAGSYWVTLSLANGTTALPFTIVR